MPYADNNGIKIHYEVEGKGPPLVLMHGLCFDLNSWRISGGYVELLKDDDQLILIDARGHGKSSKPHNSEAYKLEFMVADVVAVLDDLKIIKAHYHGYSMGGWIGWGIAKYTSHRCSSLIIGGSGPPYPADPERPCFLRDLFMQGMDAVVEAIGKMMGHRWSTELDAMIRVNDLDALIALTLNDWWCGTLGYKEFLPTITLPCLIFAGEETGEYASAKEASMRMPKVTFVSLPGLDHIEASYQADLMIPHIKKFLEQVEQANKS
jgi:pimeloyl-ACP methyl ester carboxylesterase